MSKKTCPKCGTTFDHCAPNRSEQLFAHTLDAYQTAYILDNYHLPLCQECLSDIGRHFYAHAVNPRYINHNKPAQ